MSKPLSTFTVQEKLMYLVSCWSVMSYAGLFITTVASDTCSKTINDFIITMFVVNGFCIFFKIWIAIYNLLNPSSDNDNEGDIYCFFTFHIIELFVKAIYGFSIVFGEHVGSCSDSARYYLLLVYLVEGGVVFAAGMIAVVMYFIYFGTSLCCCKISCTMNRQEPEKSIDWSYTAPKISTSMSVV